MPRRSSSSSFTGSPARQRTPAGEDPSSSAGGTGSSSAGGYQGICTDCLTVYAHPPGPGPPAGCTTCYHMAVVPLAASAFMRSSGNPPSQWDTIAASLGVGLPRYLQLSSR
eukprot:RCo002936